MLEFGAYTKDFLEPSWEWLNDPELKKLTMTPDFTKEDQCEFYRSIPQRSDYKIYGVSLSGEKIGACGLKNINDFSGEYWGYIGNKKYWGRGYGKELLDYIVELARNLELELLHLKVGKENSRAIALYEKNGFMKKMDFEDYFEMVRFL